MTSDEIIVIDFERVEEIEQELERNFHNGGAMAHGEIEAEENQLRAVAIVHPADGAVLELLARVVWVGEQDGARVVGLAFEKFGPDLRRRITEFVTSHAAPPVEEPAAAPPLRVHERMRGLTSAEQMKVAREGEVTERMVLERIYGKVVWEPILRNPRVTVPEVARIARMGTLPIPLLDLIVGNGAWLANAIVRRALLGNPRLGGDSITKVLRAMPFGELKLVPRQTVYSAQVREAARRILPK